MAGRAGQGEGNKAYVPPVVAEPTLPALPTRPTLDTDSYLVAARIYRKRKSIDQAEAQPCTVAIDKYYSRRCCPIGKALIAYQDACVALFDPGRRQQALSAAPSTAFSRRDG